MEGFTVFYRYSSKRWTCYSYFLVLHMKKHWTHATVSIWIVIWFQLFQWPEIFGSGKRSNRSIFEIKRPFLPYSRLGQPYSSCEKHTHQDKIKIPAYNPRGRKGHGKGNVHDIVWNFRWLKYFLNSIRYRFEKTKFEIFFKLHKATMLFGLLFGLHWNQMQLSSFLLSTASESFRWYVFLINENSWLANLSIYILFLALRTCSFLEHHSCISPIMATFDYR